MIVDPNTPYPLVYTDPTYHSPALKVRANIYDVSGVSPSLLASVNLSLINNGVYQEKFSGFVDGNPYVVQILVYTDNTYSVVDENFSQVTIDVQCVKGSSGGNGGSSCSMKVRIRQNFVRVIIKDQNDVNVKVGC